MEVTATAKNIGISEKKMKFLIDQIKKMGPQQAIAILDFTPKASSMPLKKAIASAMANAKNNLGLEESTLKFKSIFTTRGPMAKRFRPVSRGRAHAILKRSSHVTITLEGEQKKEVSKVSQVSDVSKEGGTTKDKGLKTKAK
ncbi:MAG TPA: 50S ribosomal protein L22 [Candidatus Saccharimonadales bacterium]|nr:50S ribosomal protein L22 [Candidatus Saccharimonadales bacterium]